MARFGSRQLRYGTNTTVLTLVVLGILGAANYLVYRHTKRWDLTKGHRYSLSEQSKKIAASLKDDVTILYFQRGTDLVSGQQRMREYQVLSPHIKVEFVDPLKDPARARPFELTLLPTLVVERGSRREKITNDSEQDITNALVKVTRESKKTVCFVEGEGERDPDDTRDAGYSEAKAALVKNQYEVQKVFLLRQGSVPAECSVLVVPGPEKDLLPPVIDAIRAFVKKGGRALLMVEPEFKDSYPNLTGLLKEFNIEAKKDVVVDLGIAGQIFGAGPFTPITSSYPYHEITKDIHAATAFHLARSMEAGKGTAEGVTAQNLIMTTNQAWAKGDLALKEPADRIVDGRDRRGPIALAAIATIRTPSAASAPASPSPGDPGKDKKDASEKSPDGQVAAFGDSDFASNALVGFQQNKDLFLNVVAYLSQDPDLISIRPKEPEDQRMFLTRQQQIVTLILALGVIPGLFVALGVASWLRRR